MISHLIVILVSLHASSTAVVNSLDTSKLLKDDSDVYPPKPTEILPIQPILLYPPSKQSPYQGRALFHGNKIIYIKLLERKSYRPKKINTLDREQEHPKKTLTMQDIFYVKTLANGQFSHNRLKLYRLPEFYAITVYKKKPFKN